MAGLPDRRRVNGPQIGTSLPRLVQSLGNKPTPRTRLPGELRKIFLQTGLVPSASGSAYLELEPSERSSPKLVCTVRGPRPLPRSAPFSPFLLLSTRVKFAPFAAHERKGHIPDAMERDLAASLETALRSAILTERVPKSGLDLSVTVLEGDTYESASKTSWDLKSLLASCITVASAAIVNAGVECVDLVTGGTAAYVSTLDGTESLVLDPSPSERIEALCVVAYLQSRDELTALWVSDKQSSDDTGTAESRCENLINNAVESASAARSVAVEVLCEGYQKDCTNVIRAGI